MKKLLCFFLAVSLLLSMGINSFAAEKAEVSKPIKTDEIKTISREESYEAKVTNSEEEEIWYFDYIHNFSDGDVVLFAPDDAWMYGAYCNIAFAFDESVEGVRFKTSGDLIYEAEGYYISDEEPWEPVGGDWNIYISVGLDANRTAEYKECSLTVYNPDNESQSATITIIVDVPIIDPDVIDENMGSGTVQGFVAGKTGISSYYYETEGIKVEMEYDFAVNDEGFSRLTGRGFFMAIENYSYMVEIEKVMSGQKGINFFSFFYLMEFGDDGGKLDEPVYVVNFFDKTKIKGNYSISFDTGYSYGELRDIFGKSDEDLVSYYIIKDCSEIIKRIDVDYTLADPDLGMWLEISESDSSLSDYAIKTDPDYIDGGKTFDDISGETTITWKVDREGTLTIGGEGYGYYSYWLTGIEIIPGVTTAPWGRYHEHINKVVIEEGIVGMVGGFYGFENIRKVILPESLAEMGYPLFPDSNLETLGPVGRNCDIEYSWKTEIPDYAFYEQDSLKIAEIHEGITRIGDSALWCEGLEAVYFEGDAPEMFPADTYESSFTENVVLYCMEDAEGFETPYHMGYRTIRHNWINPEEPEEPDEPEKKIVEITSAKIPAGKTGTVSVKIPENLGAEMIQFTVSYDSNILEVESTSSPMLDDYTINAAEEGKIYFLWDALSPLNVEGSILDIVFKVKEGIEPTKTYISFDQNEEIIFMTGSYEDIDIELVPAAVEVIDVIYGDTNGDEKINVLDANLLRRYAAKLIAFDEGQLTAGDVDGNGKINVIDANLIRRFAAKLINKFPVELL